MLNMDFSRRVVIDTNTLPWVPSPRAGVWRKPLAREDAERGHATSIVRYEAGASFNSHPHPGGEEILVLSGTFSDETGDFHAGTYFRNPFGFRHAPFSKDGCLILVKLHQFQTDDEARVAIETAKQPWQEQANGVKSLLLHAHKQERVEMLSVAKGSLAASEAFAGGEEIFVLQGAVADAGAVYRAGTWLRQPSANLPKLTATEAALLWVKRGHLPVN